MELFLFLIFFIISAVILAIIGYYYSLLYYSGKESFYREELVNVPEFLAPELLTFIESENDMQIGAMAFGFGVVFSYLWSLLANVFGVSSYSNEFSTYFFHSCFIPIVFLFGGPLLEDYLAGTMGSGEFLTKFSRQTTALVSGSAICLISENLTIYGIYHEALFFIIFLNILCLMAVVIYRKREKLMDREIESPEPDYSEDLDSEELVDFPDDEVENTERNLPKY